MVILNIGYLMRFLIHVILITLFFFSHFAYSDAGEKKIRMSGNIKNESIKSITPKILETSLKTTEIHMYNPWEKQPDAYKGVLFNEFVRFYGAGNVSLVTLEAIDDYKVSLTKKMWQNERILLVTRVNGEYISLRKKGPLRIIFIDYDSAKKKYELNLPLWMWMINKIDFE